LAAPTVFGLRFLQPLLCLPQLMFKCVQLVFLGIHFVLSAEMFSMQRLYAGKRYLLLGQGQFKRTDALKLEHFIEGSRKAAGKRTTG
jgi:hypothetical protein